MAVPELVLDKWQLGGNLPLKEHKFSRAHGFAGRARKLARRTGMSKAKRLRFFGRRILWTSSILWAQIPVECCFMSLLGTGGLEITDSLLDHERK